LVEQARFRAAFDFLRLRADVAEVDLTLADWWQEFSMADDATREDLVQQVKAERPKPVARRAPRPAGTGSASVPNEAMPIPAHDATWGDEGETSDAPKKRRRRRRSSGGSGGTGDAAGRSATGQD
jgi:poly(A) polymerase